MIKADSKKAANALDKVADQLEDFIPEGMDHFVDVEMEESQRLVPVKTGELKASNYKNATTKRKDLYIAEMGYTAEHAEIVHEDLSAIRQSGQAKYLEQPLNEAAPFFPSRVMDYAARKSGIS